MYYRQEGPGCGGCLMIAALLVLVTGGAPALLNFFGVLFFSGLTGLLLLGALFFGFSYYLRKKVTSYEQSQSESHNQFVWLLVQILIRIAAIDGHISREEVQTIHNFFQYHLRYNQTQMLWVKDLIKAATASTTPLETLLQEFKSTFTYQPRLILVELIYQLLYTKQPVSHEDLLVARNVAHFLEISEYELRAIEAKYQYRQQQQSTASDNRTSQSLAVLGLEAGASEDEIKRAYRALSMQYHPDKVQHLGQEFQQVAEEKMKEINAAYDYLKKTLRVKS